MYFHNKTNFLLLFFLLKSIENVHFTLFFTPVPSKHTTLFQRPSDVHYDQMTLKRRQNNVLCQQGSEQTFLGRLLNVVSCNKQFPRMFQCLQRW